MGSNVMEDTEARHHIDKHESKCLLRYTAINARLRRIENILLVFAGSAFASISAILILLINYIL